MPLKFLFIFILMSFTSLFSLPSFSADKIYTTSSQQLAIEGYDPVAYFTENKAMKGSAKYQVEHKGAHWQFATQAHLEKFKQNPEKYMPQYGGYCAWSVAHNSLAAGDPKQWTIYQDKLYLNYNAATKSKWRENKDKNIQLAGNFWPEIL